MPSTGSQTMETEFLKSEKGQINKKLIAEDGCLLCEMDHRDPIVRQFATFAKVMKFI